MYFKTLIFAILYLSNVNAHQRSPPGVPPAQYQQQQAQPGQYQQHPNQQQQQYQRGVPGVPPSTYQEPQQQFQPPPPPPPQQQYQQPQQQKFQPPPQQQQQFQAQQQQQYQQPAQHQGAHHQNQQRVLHSDNIEGERDHIKDHMDVPLDTAGMSEEELQYHYFKMHDADNNNRLDGQELIKSLFHWHDSSNHDHTKNQAPPAPKIFTNEELSNMIDPIMDQDDRNRDGYIDYPEFVNAQKKAAASNTGSNAV